MTQHNDWSSETHFPELCGSYYIWLTLAMHVIDSNLLPSRKEISMQQNQTNDGL